MLVGQFPRLLADARLEHAAEYGDTAMRGRQRAVLLRRDMDPLELLEVGDVEAVGAEHGEDHGQEGEAVEEAEYDAEERHLRKRSWGHWRCSVCVNKMRRIFHLSRAKEKSFTSKSGGTWDERTHHSNCATNLEEDEVGVRLRHGEEDQCEGCCDSAVHDGRTHLRKAGVRSLLAGACKGILHYAH